MSRINGRGSPPDLRGMFSVKVDNVDYRATADDLRPVFARFGILADVYIPRDPSTKKSRGYAFVRYFDKRDAKDAVRAMDGFIFNGRELLCKIARYGRPIDEYRRIRREQLAHLLGQRDRSRSPIGRSRSRSADESDSSTSNESVGEYYRLVRR
ncbi:serine/arginine-rich splicing factor 2 [Biomphalaria glabrata]|uniref:Serine/arginine-rich splicing factor 2 n=1 Tax=Biomphalaria glabrata TaxID=6526 RepID=A0A2C9JJA8_BIOGL|nr:serine/arginine-rich splicing factor 2-like [Biomphalaria glabrata]KAI8735289.1 serine/arginine-rich splicing factor 2-like [Biomphalaria glabrata]KAI8784569.1 serine/arginine-rich splicing factor 2 [Biomphalaria glabrata]